MYDENGDFVGILKGVLNIEEIIKIVKGIEGSSEYETFKVHLINRDGKVIYGKDHYILEDLSGDIPLNKIDGSQGYFEERGWGPDKDKSLFSYALSKGYGDFEGLRWIFFIEYQTEEIFAPVTKLRNNILIISVVVTIFAILTGFFISRRISNPVTKLKNAAIEIGKGKLGVEIEVESHDEIGQLAGSFRKMTEDLKKTTTSIDHLNKEIVERTRAEEALQRARDDLEERVEERTTELSRANVLLKQEIAERKQAETKLKLYAAELERSNQELQQFAYVASHDLQEPLRMVASYTQLLEKRYKGKLDSDADEFIAYAVDGATRMQALINDLLAYSRVRTKGKDFGSTDCNAILERTLDNLRKAVEESGAEVTYEPLPTVMADDVQLGQLFQNLIGNAIRFHGEEPLRIHVSAQKNENQWVFSVQDNGIGIDPEYAERIFLIFQRLHGRGDYPGTGIGLAVCKKIVERHGGRIWVESKPERGSTFYFTIPLRGGISHE